MKSPDVAVISQPNQSIVDSYNTSWSIVNGQVTVDGVVDASTNRVTQLVYANGKIWQENTDNLWWSKSASFDASWSPAGGSPVSPLPQSPNNSVITQPDQFLVDANGTIWTIVKGQVAVNGVIDASTGRVTVLALENGQVWQENADQLWWSKSTPSDTWNPPGGTSANPLPQTSNNTVISEANQFIVDTNGRTWSIVGSQVAVDGSADPTTSRVTELAYENGKVWQENTDRLWWSKSTPSDTWDPPGGTPASPVLNVSRTWFGGSAPFATAADWSGGVLPQPGDTALVQSGSVTISPGDATGVNFLLGDASGQTAAATGPSLTFMGDQPNNVGTITVATGTQATVTVLEQYNSGGSSTAGIQISGGQLSISEYQGFPFIVNGDSSLTNGATLTVGAFNGGEAPAPNFVNNGTLSVNASTASLGELSGQGVVSVTNNGNLSVIGATAGETIQLQSGHLDFGSDRYRLPFLATITDFGADSSVNISNAHLLADQNPQEVFTTSGPTAGELFIYEGTGAMVDLHISGQSQIYASLTGTGGGGVLLTAYDTGHSLPIATS